MRYERIAVALKSARRHTLAAVIRDTLGRRVTGFALNGPPAPSTLSPDDSHNPLPVQASSGLFVSGGHRVPAFERLRYSGPPEEAADRLNWLYSAIIASG